MTGSDEAGLEVGIVDVADFCCLLGTVSTILKSDKEETAMGGGGAVVGEVSPAYSQWKQLINLIKKRRRQEVMKREEIVTLCLGLVEQMERKQRRVSVEQV